MNTSKTKQYLVCEHCGSRYGNPVYKEERRARFNRMAEMAKSGMTLNQIAQKEGISASSVSHILRGRISVQRDSNPFCDLPGRVIVVLRSFGAGPGPFGRPSILKTVGDIRSLRDAGAFKHARSFGAKSSLELDFWLDKTPDDVSTDLIIDALPAWARKQILSHTD